MHCVYVPHLLYTVICGSIVSLIPSLGYCILWGQNHKVTHLFKNFDCLNPPQPRHETQAWSGSRDGIAAQIREVIGNKLGIAFFPIVFFNVILKLCWSIVNLQFLLAASVQPPDSVMAYTYSVSVLFWILLPQRLLLKVTQSSTC